MNPNQNIHTIKRLQLIFSLLLYLSVSNSAKAVVRTNDTVRKVSGKNTTLTIISEKGITLQVIRLKNNLRDGLQEKYNNEGKLLEKINYEAGFLEGSSIFYFVTGEIREKKKYKYDPDKKISVLNGGYESYRNGIPQLKCNYKNDQLHGKYTKYRMDGKLETVTTYENGLIKGDKTSYNYLGGISGKAKYTIIEENGVKKSVMDGKYSYYDNSGQLTEEGEYKKGKRGGVQKKYNKGELLSIVSYKDDKRHGHYVSYEGGKLKSEGNYYESIVYKDVVLKNVSDGLIKSYYKDGQLERSESYEMGKKTGTWEHYHSNGKLKTRNNYKDNLQVGVSEAWDMDGNKTYQVNYKIIEEKGVKKSVMDGKELRWEKGILVFERNFKDGIETGKRISYHKDGKVKAVENIRDKNFEGGNVEYHPNGNIKSRSNYKTIKDASGKEKNIRYGWQMNFDEEGRLTTKHFYNEQGEVFCSVEFYQGQQVWFSLKDNISVYYFPDGKVQSYSFYANNSRKCFDHYFYWNGITRKIIFENPENDIVNYLEFSNAGELISTYSDQHQNPEDKKPGKAITQLYTDNVGNNFLENKFFTDSVKDGKYILYYGNQQIAAELNFKDDLPNGTFVFYDPVSHDTLSYKKYREGVREGYYVDKFAGKTVTNKGKTPEANGIVWKESFFPNGLPYRKEAFDADGKLVEQHEFHSNGVLKSKHNYVTGDFESYDENRQPTGSGEMLDLATKLIRYKTYFPVSGKLKSINYTRNGLRDSIYEGYHESGQLSFRAHYKAGKRHGLYESYLENGLVNIKGKYVNDLQDGIFVTSKDGIIDSSYYRNGRREIKPSQYACQCYDTLKPHATGGFAPWIKGLLEYPVLAKFLPDNIVPYDSLNYTSIFYTGMQNSSSRGGAFYTMNLMLFKELSFSIPSDEQLKICLNPCITQGYQSRMQISVTTSTNEEETYAWFDPKRISIELPNSPLKSTETKQPVFRAYMDVKSVELRRQKKLSFEFINKTNNCFTPGIINNFLSITVKQANPLIFENPNEVNYKRVMKVELAKKELSNFFGFNVTEADLKFNYTYNGKENSILATSDLILAGGNYVAGRIDISCTKNDAGTFSYKLSNETIILEEKKIREEWLLNGFSRLQFEYDENSKLLSIHFFAQ